MDRSTCALIVFAKSPEAGQVKTRLTSMLDPAAAADLYRAFLRDALVSYAKYPMTVRLYAAPPAADFPEAIIPRGVELHEQQGDGLGARMSAAFSDTFAAGFSRCVIIGTDHPTLPRRYIREAFDVLLEGDPLVIGPSNDGGYYLLGTRRFMPFLFDEMSYSHPEVLDQTIDRAEEKGVGVHLLPPWYDVDTPSDLHLMIDDLRDSPSDAPRTYRVLRDLSLL